MVVSASLFINDPLELAEILGISATPLETVHKIYPFRVSRYYLDLARQHGAPLLKQIVPDLLEVQENETPIDPLAEEVLSPTPCLIHKYPDRAVLLVCRECATYCRFCTRKRKVGTEKMHMEENHLQEALTYLRATPAIRDVLISGGDPLLLSDERLDYILKSVRVISSVKTIRLGTRIPCTLPMRVTEHLVAVLSKHHPLYVNLHFNHPAEITPEAEAACSLLVNAGIPLGCQTVLLKGVNDSVEVLRQLFYQLLAARVKPYYLFQADLTRGTAHFRTTIDTGMNIMRQLQGNMSGMALPTYALDTPGGGGKIPLYPSYLQELGSQCLFHTYRGQTGEYPNTTWPVE